MKCISDIDGVIGKVVRSILIAVMVASVNTIAMAQVNDTKDDKDVLLIDEIIVTARNREETLQDIPLSITAFGRDDIKKRSIEELSDVARFTPGFSFEDFSGGFATPIIRGQAQTSITALEQNVASFFDGLYVPRSWAIDVGTSNIERIEIVKGPQSARYGRNAFAGAINYVPIKANIGTEEVVGEIDITFGSDEREDFGGYVEIPLSDKFVVAASYNSSEFDGSWNNTHPFANLDVGTEKSTNGNVGGWDNSSYSVSLAAELTENWSAELAFYNYEQQNEARPNRTFDHNVSQDVFNAGGLQFGNQLLINGELPEPVDSVVVDPRAFGVHSDTDTVRFSTTVQFSESWSATYLFGSVEGDTDIGTSTEPGPSQCGTIIPAFVSPPNGLCNFQTAPIGSIDYDSHDLRFNFEGASYRVAFGLFTSEGEDDFTFISFNIPPLLDPNNFVSLVGQTAPNFAGVINVPLRSELTSTDVNSVFGEFQWTSPSGVTRLGAELRYSETEVNLEDRLDGRVFNEEYTVLTPRFTYERDLSEERLFFASLARGAKTGGFNAGAIAVENQAFDEEFNWTLEAGLKNTLLDGRLQLNGSVFYTDWTDVQINSADPNSDNPNTTNIVLNLGDADVFGIEIDTAFQATENLSLDATLSFADATYKSGTLDQRFARPASFGQAPCDDIVCNSNGDIGGNEVERAPRTQFSAGAQWDASFAWGDYYIRGDLSWQSDFFADTVNLAEIPSRTLINLKAGLNFENGLSLSAWVKNLTDEEYVSNSFVVITAFNNQYGTFFGQQRTLGVNATYRF